MGSLTAANYREWNHRFPFKFSLVQFILELILAGNMWIHYFLFSYGWNYRLNPLFLFLWTRCHDQNSIPWIKKPEIKKQYFFLKIWQFAVIKERSLTFRSYGLSSNITMVELMTPALQNLFGNTWQLRLTKFLYEWNISKVCRRLFPECCHKGKYNFASLGRVRSWLLASEKKNK